MFWQSVWPELQDRVDIKTMNKIVKGATACLVETNRVGSTLKPSLPLYLKADCAIVCRSSLTLHWWVKVLRYLLAVCCPSEQRQKKHIQFTVGQDRRDFGCFEHFIGVGSNGAKSEMIGTDSC